MRLAALVMCVAAGGPPEPLPAGSDAPPSASPPVELRVFPARWRSAPQDMPLPVFDGVAISRRGEVAIIGGFGPDLATTPAIQVRHQSRGWQAIGSQMLEARALHTVSDLGDGRVLIAGGVQGTLGGELAPLATAEVLNPFTAGSVAIAPLDEPLIGHTAHVIGEGVVAIVGRNHMHLFDAASQVWTESIALVRPRRHHAAVVLRGGSLLIIGGEGENSIERVHLEPARRGSTPWDVTLTSTLVHAAAALLPDGRVLVVGGVDEAQACTIDSTWLIDPAEGTIEPGPALALANGVCDAHLAIKGPFMAVLGGEWVRDGGRGPANTTRLIDIGKAINVWALSAMPDDFSRRMWCAGDLTNATAFGGYRFRAAAEADPSGAPAGVSISRNELSLEVMQMPRVPD